jgi:tetratricopeptide (TPR) repeat protein
MQEHDAQGLPMRSPFPGMDPCLENLAWEPGVHAANNYYTLGNTYYHHQQNYAQAIDAYRKVIELRPRNADAYVGLGSSYCGQQDYANAILAYEKAIEINPKNVSAYLGLGAGHTERKYYLNATLAYQQAIDINPREGAAYLGLGIVCYYQRDFAQEIAYYRMATDFDCDGDYLHRQRFHTVLFMRPPNRRTCREPMRTIQI